MHLGGTAYVYIKIYDIIDRESLIYIMTKGEQHD